MFFKERYINVRLECMNEYLIFNNKNFRCAEFVSRFKWKYLEMTVPVLSMVANPLQHVHRAILILSFNFIPQVLLR